MSIPGLDGRHTWNSAIVMEGDNETLESFPSEPYYVLTEIGGWRSLPDTELASDPAHSRHADVPRTSKRRGKTVAYTGSVVASNPSDMHEAADELLAEFFSTEPGEMLVEPLVGGASYFYRARPLSIVSDEKWIVGPHDSRSGGFERAYVLSLRMDDPRFFLTTQTSAESTGNPTATPAGAPWSWTTNSTGYGTNSVAVNVTNTGLADADPVIELRGPTSGSVVAPRLANFTAQVGLRFSESLQIAAGDKVVIDFAERSCIRDSNGEDVDRYRVADWSDWWDDGVPGLLKNAAQSIRYGAKTTGAGMKVVVKFYPPRF